MSSYVKRAMQPDEKIVFAAQLHWIIYYMGIVITFFGAAFGYAGSRIVYFVLGEHIGAMVETPVRYVAIGLIALGAFQLVASFIRQISTELVITDRRIIAKHGFISTTSYELMMTKVEGATIEQSILGRILGYGTLMVKGTGGGISPIDHVAEPYRFHAALMNALSLSHDAHGAVHHAD